MLLSQRIQIFIFSVLIAIASGTFTNSQLDGYECIGATKWKIAKFDAYWCYGMVAVRTNASRTEATLANNFCMQTYDSASFPVSIHSQAENDYLEEFFINGFIGLYQPGNGPWDPSLFQWSDGTPLDYQNWDTTYVDGSGVSRPQPDNGKPIERLVKLRMSPTSHGWHDFNARDLTFIICKKPATLIGGK